MGGLGMRRKRLVLAIAALALVGAACNYPNYRGDAGHTGDNPLENAISVSNASTLAPAFTAPLGDFGAYPVEANGIVYVQLPTRLMAFSAEGDVNCGGTPTTCTPLWTATLTGFGGGSAPTVANGVVYITATTTVGGGDELLAFDAAGTTNCSGTPKVCQPLWEGVGADAAPNVVNGVVYTGSSGGNGGLLAFDAAGNTNCSGTPKVCQPLWTGEPTTFLGTFTTSSPAVANGVAYLASSGALYAFDATGKTGCSGTPKVCTQLWTAPVASSTAAPFGLTSAAVTNGTAYLTSDGTLYAFDATGATNCSGLPKTCSPLWTAPNAGGSPAIANGTLYVDSTPGVSAFDATGNTGCSGTPKTCGRTAKQDPSVHRPSWPMVSSTALLGSASMPGTRRARQTAQAPRRSAAPSSPTQVKPP
jgi:PQQ-like domain